MINDADGTFHFQEDDALVITCYNDSLSFLGHASYTPRH